MSIAENNEQWFASMRAKDDSEIGAEDRLRDAYSLVQGVATALASACGADPCPPVTSGNIFAVVDECLARIKRLSDSYADLLDAASCVIGTAPSFIAESSRRKQQHFEAMTELSNLVLGATRRRENCRLIEAGSLPDHLAKAEQDAIGVLRRMRNDMGMCVFGEDANLVEQILNGGAS